MRYDKELQNAGKLFVKTFQGEDGAKGRRNVKWLQDNPNCALMLSVSWQDGKLVAAVCSASGLDKYDPLICDIVRGYVGAKPDEFDEIPLNDN